MERVKSEAQLEEIGLLSVFLVKTNKDMFICITVKNLPFDLLKISLSSFHGH